MCEGMPRATHDVAQAQRVPPDRVGAVQHRDELVHAPHGVTRASVARGTSRSTKRSAADAEVEHGQPLAARRDHRVPGGAVSRSRAAMAAANT